MSRLQIFRAPHVLKWVSLLCAESNFTSSKLNLYKIRLYRTESSVDLRNGVEFGGNGKIARAVRAQAQSALLEYFHLTRSLRIMDAENMSRNAPEFVDRLMKRVNANANVYVDDDEIKYSVTRFLRYHPINEFEPFFESIGLKHSEYAQFLPRGLMFLADDELLLENYYVLCNYGIERNRIGKIFKEFNEVFRYDYGALQPKLRSLENLGLRQSIVAKIIASSPRLLRGDAGEFVEFIEMLKKLEIEYDWLLDHIHEEDSYNWKCMLQLMCLLCKSGFSEKQVGELFKKHPSLLLESSGCITFGLISFLLKFGSTVSDVQTLFLQFPQMPVSKFACNFHNSYIFLVRIGMSAQDICWLVRSYPVLLGSIKLRKRNNILTLLGCGMAMIRQMVKDDPFTLEKWVLGRRIQPNENQKRGVRGRALKTQFLISLGYEENSTELEKALKIIRGRGVELDQRFNCLMKNGLSHEEGLKMVKTSPQILNQTSDVMETKIRLLLDDLGYKVSDLLTHPKIISYTTERLKLRLLMYKWLKDQGLVRRNLALSTLMASSDETFLRSYVYPYAKAPAFWKSLDKNILTGNK